MTDYFIADMHFGAEGAARSRGFANSTIMDEAISHAWRRRVMTNDTVWIIGDVGSPEPPLAELPGGKPLVLGNADVPVRRFRSSPVFLSAERSAEIVTGAGILHLIHRPQDASKTGIQGVVHGHIHEKRWPDPRFICVSVDQTGWGPISLNEVLDRLVPKAA